MALQPLQGFVVGVTADRRAGEQAELLRRRGARVVHGPVITTSYLAADDALRRATLALIERPPTHLVALTGIGVRAWFETAQAWGLDRGLAAALQGSLVVARGPKAAAALAAVGLDAWRTAPDERSAGALEAMAPSVGPGSRVAVQLDGAQDDVVVGALADLGASVVPVPVYRWRLPSDVRAARALVEAVAASRVHAVTFTAGPAVQHFFALADDGGLRDEVLAAVNGGAVAVACVGPVCAEAATAAGVARPVWPPVGRLGLMVRSLTDHLVSTRREVAAGGRRLVIQGDVVLADDTVIRLSRREADVLRALAARPGSVVPRAALGTTSPESHAVEVAVARLRRALGPLGHAVQTVRRRGYRLAPD